MKIVLRAFNNKLSGVMEVPEETGLRFKLQLTQPVAMKSSGYGMGEESPLMSGPIETICEFEYTGKVFMQTGHAWDGAREYQLVSVVKR